MSRLLKLNLRAGKKPALHSTIVTGKPVAYQVFVLEPLTEVRDVETAAYGVVFFPEAGGSG